MNNKKNINQFSISLSEESSLYLRQITKLTGIKISTIIDRAIKKEIKENV